MRRTPYIVRENAECRGEYVATVMSLYKGRDNIEAECRGEYVATVLYGAEGLEASASTRARTREEMLGVGSMAAHLSLSLRAKAKA